MSGHYHNENDPFAAAWLRELMKLKLIPEGDVDERSIADVQPDDLKGFVQCHFFAGIGGWPYALRLAGFPEDREIWTGSCPCQPFSVAGKGGGADDVRHLWPDFFRLIRARRPALVMGEQVAGKAGYGWFDGVGADLAGENYACRGVDIPACAVDAPHIRQRLYWVAVADDDQRRARLELSRESQGAVSAWAAGQGSGHDGGDLAQPRRGGPGGRTGEPGGDQRDGSEAGRGEGASWPAECDEAGVALGHASLSGLALGSIDQVGRGAVRDQGAPLGAADDRGGGARDVADSEMPGREAHDSEPCGDGSGRSGAILDVGSNRPATFWSGAEWIACHDGKARRTQPGLPLLAHGVPRRVAKWRGLGNAIVPSVAAEVIAAFLDAEQDAIFANAADLNAAYRAGRLAYAEAIGQPVLAAKGMRV